MREAVNYCLDSQVKLEYDYWLQALLSHQVLLPVENHSTR